MSSPDDIKTTAADLVAALAESGPHKGVPCGARDILEELPAEQQSALLQLMLDTALDAIIAHQADGTIIFFSQGACALLGYDSEHMLSLPPFGWIAPEAHAGSAGRLEKILHEGSLRFESAAIRSDGSIVPTEVAARRVSTEVGPLIVAVIRNISERLETQRTLMHLAYHDSLTGLANRAQFEERLRLAIADVRRHGDRLALAYIDLDRFKPINDQWGHSTGDAVLVEVARRLREAVREQDVVARLGGDEFVVLLPRVADDLEISVIAKRLIDRIAEPITALDHCCDISASIGFAFFDPEADDERSLIVNADVAMYAAKLDPAHPWLLYRPCMDERIDERREHA